MPGIKKETAVAVPLDNQIVSGEKALVNLNLENLISLAIQQNSPVEALEKLLAMRKDLKAEWAKEQFDKAMAKFQSECPTIQKTKEVKTKSGMVAYSYAPIESIVEQVKKPLQENGFSYSTGQELLPNGVKISVKVTHKDGHSEVTTMEVPLGNKTDIMSQTQVVAAASTFAKRYAFCNAFGILTGDEDNDAAPQIPSPKTATTNRTWKPAKKSELVDEMYSVISKAINLDQLEDIARQITTLSKEFSTTDLNGLRRAYKAKQDELSLPVINQNEDELNQIAEKIPFE